MISYIKGGIQAKGIWKQDPKANIWAQEGWERREEKAPKEEIYRLYCSPNMFILNLIYI